ncbi:SHD1 domain-containing protein [bacterium]|nr:SHD1 domain-containing protein [bacterium]
MRFYKLLIGLALTFAYTASSFGLTDVREWTDASGHYTFKADLIAYDSEHVVLQKENKDLVSVAIKDLSDADRAFLKSSEAEESKGGEPDELRTWKLDSGLKVKGKVVEYGERDLKVKRYLRGETYVNDRDIENLPPVYQELIPKMVAHFAKQKFENVDAMNQWLEKQPNREVDHKCEGVMLELENGDRYGLPFFLFTAADRTTLERGWQRFKSAEENKKQQEKESFYLRAQAQANAQNQQALREISEMNLQLQGYNAGLYDLWEVTLIPARGNYGRPMKVVVPGTNSRQATQAALQRYPGAQIGPIARVRNRRR